MRRAVSGPVLYLAVVSVLVGVQMVEPDVVAVRAALIVLTLPWNVVFYYLVGVFGADLPGFINDGQASVLGVASVLAQTAFLAHLGARADRKRASHPSPGHSR